MKQTCLFLLILLALTCIWQGHELLTTNEYPPSYTSGSLSDIAEEVIAIPLQTNDQQPIKTARYVRQEGSNLFLISNETLYRFSRNGDFICQITTPEHIRVAGYVINPVKKQLIVLGNTDDIFYYSYEGKLVERKKLTTDFSDRRMMSAVLYKEHIWTTEECTITDSTHPSVCIERQVVEYDSSFRKLNTHKLVQADLGREQCLSGCLVPGLSVSEDSGKLYASSPSLEADKLLRDSLFLKNKRTREGTADDENGIPLFPIRFGNRLWVSSYFNDTDPSLNYIFCYDCYTDKSWHTNQLKDNFYQTGSVSRLEAMDLYNNAYYFCKSGKEVRDAFPESAETDSTVLFIVKLKA